MDFEKYLEGEEYYLKEVNKIPSFSILIPLTNRLYNLSIELIPPDTNPFYGRRLLLCHKCFLSAASLIGRAQPDDAAPVIRRAIEIAEVAFAVKYDRDNYERWLSFETRMDRWKARMVGERPRSPRFPKLKLPTDHQILKELGEGKGSYSDSAVHHTPEYFITQEWKEDGGEIFLNYFAMNQRDLERAIILFTGTHHNILRLFDECLDGALSANDGWERLRLELVTNGHQLSQQFKNP
ncbi:MAG: hypothetical protein RX316_10035 [bacterium]|nr:hypothetical protein [bacterium]